MISLEVFKTQLDTIMNALAKNIAADVKLDSMVYMERDGNEGELETLIKIKCMEASNGILTLLRELAVGVEKAESSVVDHLQDPTSVSPAGPTSEPPDGEGRPAPAPLDEERSSPPGLPLHPDHRYIRTTADATEIAVIRPVRVRHTCRHCSQVFSAAVDLRDHQRHAHGVVERPYACDHCEKTFIHKPHRDRHHRLHRGERGFRCGACGKAYTTVSHLKTHERTHVAKSFICDVCGSAFYHAGHLTRHKLVHAEARPYRCDLCGKGFTQAEGLRIHQVTHSGERQLCPVCGKRYRSLKHHMVNKHAEELPCGQAESRQYHACEVPGCGRRFLYPSLLSLHRKRTHAAGKSGGGGQAERRQKNHACDYPGCGRRFLYPSLLSLHRKRTHGGGKTRGGGGGGGGRDDRGWPEERPFACATCGATFNTAGNLSRHASIHTGEMPFSCSECGKSFRLFDFLKTHEKVHLRRKPGNEPCAAAAEGLSDDARSVV